MNPLSGLTNTENYVWRGKCSCLAKWLAGTVPIIRENRPNDLHFPRQPLFGYSLYSGFKRIMIRSTPANFLRQQLYKVVFVVGILGQRQHQAKNRPVTPLGLDPDAPAVFFYGHFAKGEAHACVKAPVQG